MRALGRIGNHFKRVIAVCILMSSFARVFAQENPKESDTIPSTVNEYIDDHKKQLNVKFEVSNDINEFSFEDDGKALTFETKSEPQICLCFQLQVSECSSRFKTEHKQGGSGEQR